MGIAALCPSYEYRIVRIEPLSLRERGAGSARTADGSKMAVSDG